MTKAVSATVRTLVALIWFGACSGGGAKPSPADAASESVSNTCERIWICVAMGTAGDDAWVQMCLAKGSAQAQATYQALATCTAGSCAANDFECGCQQTCFADGNCLTEVEACLAGASDELACMFCR
jgi:hypothetical protein